MGEVGQFVSFSTEVSDAEQFGTDTEWGEISDQADLSHSDALVVRRWGFRPGPVGYGAEGFHELGRGAPGDAGLGEDLTDIGEQRLEQRLDSWIGGLMDWCRRKLRGLRELE